MKNYANLFGGFKKPFKPSLKPRKRIEDSFRRRKISLKEDESKSFKTIVQKKLDNVYDNYYREIYIAKYQNKIKFLEKQIELLQSQKSHDTFSYRMSLSNIVAQMEKAQEEISKWEMGKKETFDTKKVKIAGIEIKIPIKGKGNEYTLISDTLAGSIERIEELENELKRKDISNISKIGLSIKTGFWKYIRAVSKGTIKFHATTWSKIQDIVIHKPNLITSLKESENDLEERLERVRTVR
ncbi:MAG: hypothetical protein IKL65_03835 [Bacilli bacterium]|nr:hypothetical protein [Bacilli bacterium]